MNLEIQTTEGDVLMITIGKPEEESNVLREMCKNVPFPRRPVAAVPPQM